MSCTNECFLSCQNTEAKQKIKLVINAFRNYFRITHILVYLNFNLETLKMMARNLLSYFFYFSTFWADYQVRSRINPELFFISWWEQDGRVVKAPDFGSKGPRFDPRQQPLVQLSLWWFKQSHTNSWSLFSLFTAPSFGWDVKPRPRVNRLTGAGSFN